MYIFEDTSKVQVLGQIKHSTISLINEKSEIIFTDLILFVLDLIGMWHKTSFNLICKTVYLEYFFILKLQVK